MKILLGLGNIGNKYAGTRHNCGFIVLDNFVMQIEDELGIKIKWKEESKLKAITAKIPYKNQILFLAKPTTLMNLSGEAAANILNFFKEPAENLIVIFDDLDLPIGTTRFKEKGSAGTHNGMKSVIEKLGTQEFKRIKIGIESRGELAPEKQDTSSFVLSNFTKEELPQLKKGVNEAIEKIKELIS